MGKWESRILSIAKAVPTIMGASAGFWVAPVGGTSPINRLQNGDGWQAIEALTANYTFFSPNNQKFEMNQGLGVKALVAGLAISKLIGYVEKEV